MCGFDIVPIPYLVQDRPQRILTTGLTGLCATDKRINTAEPSKVARYVGLVLDRAASEGTSFDAQALHEQG